MHVLSGSERSTRERDYHPHSVHPTAAAKMKLSLSNSLLFGLLALILALRLTSLGLHPLLDSIEARHAEIARQILELSDWITPLLNPSVALWGTPPVSLWGQAASMQLLGINEFALRLPAWLIHLFSCLVIIHLGRRERSLTVGLLAAVIYSSGTLGVLISGVVVSDSTLSLALLLAYAGFWSGMAHGQRNAARLGFIGLGLGVLAKGPLILLLCAIAALLWVVFTRQWRQLWCLPWRSGLLLMLSMTLPWYAFAEFKSPGFFEHLLIGEHLQRYLTSDWHSGLLSDTHDQPLGTIWLYLLAALFPWSLLLPLLHLHRRDTYGSAWHLFLWCWALVTPLFFSLSGNIAWTYVLPALPAWALLLADTLSRWRGSHPMLIAGFALTLPVLALTLLLEGSLEQHPQNQRDLVQAWQRANVTQPGPLLYLERKSDSASFYSAGKAQHIDTTRPLPELTVFYLARRLSDPGPLLPAQLDCVSIAQTNASLLRRCQPLLPPTASSPSTGHTPL